MPRQGSPGDGHFDSLKRDVDYLGRALGTVLREIEGEKIFALVERVRALTKGLRSAPRAADREELEDLLASLSAAEAERLVRAFTVYFQLVNLAEEIHRVRVTRRRAMAATAEAPAPESVAAAVQRLRDDGWSRERALALVRRLDVQLTLTAHPTEVKRYTVRLKLERIAAALRDLREQELAPAERREREARILAEIATLWRTRELVAEKPGVLDEVKSALYYYRRSLLDAVPRIQRDLESALAACYGEPAAESPPLPPVVRFRSWIGGDRDGNPHVTPEVTAETVRLQAAVALQRHLADVDLLVQRLSQWRERLPASAALDELEREVEALSERHGPPDRFVGEPYRRRLFFVHRALREALASVRSGGAEPDGRAAAGPPGGDAYSAELAELERTLAASGDAGAARAFVRPALQRAAAFGFHLAALDLREHSAAHEAAVAEILERAGVTGSYATLSEAERSELLADQIAPAEPLLEPAEERRLGPETRRALEFLRVLGAARAGLGEAAAGGYVVSMTEGASDVLEVLVLGRQAGFRDLDSVPLFETLADLDRAPSVVDELLAVVPYREHLDRRGVQEVMIGYSDSNKDAGFLAASWALWRAQDGVARALGRAGVACRIFHGRGTSIGRGGGPAGRAILAQPPGSLGGRMRMTEQGEALDDRYSDPDLAHRHLEQVVHAFLLSSARDAAGTAPELPETYRRALDGAAEAARALYRGLLEADGFLDFYHQATPIDEISRLDIGSRPARRRGEPSLANLRAIPWVFSWTQCRANLPGWYGLGSGLERVDDALLAEMYREWPFFSTLLDLAQMSLAKADLGIFDAYLGLVGDGALGRRLGDRVRDEHRRSVDAVRRATGRDLLAGDPVLARSIRLRNPYVDPISYLQVELLRRLRALPSDHPERPALDHAVKISLLGISAGMRNTG